MMKKKLIITGPMRSGTTLVANFLNSVSTFSVYRDFLHVKRVRDAAGVEHIGESLGPAEKKRAKRKHNRMTSLLPVDNADFFVDSWPWHTVLGYYVNFLSYLRDGKEVIGHKTTHAGEVLNQLLASVPGLRAIYVVRDPRDVVISAARKWPHQQRGQTGRVMQRWKVGLNEALKAKSNHEERIYLLRFEDLVLRPNSEIDHLQEFLGVSMSMPEQLVEYGNVWKGNSSFEEVDDLLDTSAVGRWKTKRPWLKQVEEYCGALMSELAYNVSEGTSQKVHLWGQEEPPSIQV